MKDGMTAIAGSIQALAENTHISVSVSDKYVVRTIVPIAGMSIAAYCLCRYLKALS